MKIALDIGHNVAHDRGAAGVKKEDDLTRELGGKLRALIESTGHEVVMVTPPSAISVGHSLLQRVSKANARKCDLYVSLHFNAFFGRAHGTEVYCHSTTASKYAQQVQDEMVKLGFHDRGVKYANFYVLRKTTMPAILVECCFCDSHRDMSLYNSTNMAIAIKNGIFGKKSSYLPSRKSYKLRVQRSTWLKGSPEQQLLLEETENSAIDEDEKFFLERGTYTIDKINPVEEAHYWVKLKSKLEGYVYEGDVSIVG